MVPEFKALTDADIDEMILWPSEDSIHFEKHYIDISVNGLLIGLARIPRYPPWPTAAELWNALDKGHIDSEGFSQFGHGDVEAALDMLRKKAVKS